MTLRNVSRAEITVKNTFASTYIHICIYAYAYTQNVKGLLIVSQNTLSAHTLCIDTSQHT